MRTKEIYRVRESFNSKSERPLIAWQEIDEADGKRDGVNGEEHKALKNYMPMYNWVKFGSHVPLAIPPDWVIEKAWAPIGHKGLAKVTPHRPITCALIRHRPSGIRMVLIGSHVVPGAHTNPGQSHEALRKKYWNQWFTKVKAIVKEWNDKGYPVIFMADTNHPNVPKIHPKEKRFVHRGLDVILGVDGDKIKMTKVNTKHIDLRIDGHNAHAARIKFSKK